MRGGAVTFGASVRRRLFENQNGLCFYTNVILDIATAHVDHKVPIARGGTNDFSNLVLCTPEANQLKHSKTAEEFMEWLQTTGLFKKQV
jgi:CRISPR/Cas system Type II protein with McrA/HNH and RuvC-like nuclease domain